MTLWEWLASWFQEEKEEARCDHRKNYVEHRSLSADGTPLLHFMCNDCGAEDQGQVDSHPRGWAGLTKCTDGVRISVL